MCTVLLALMQCCSFRVLVEPGDCSKVQVVLVSILVQCCMLLLQARSPDLTDQTVKQLADAVATLPEQARAVATSMQQVLASVHPCPALALCPLAAIPDAQARRLFCCQLANHLSISARNKCVMQEPCTLWH